MASSAIPDIKNSYAVNRENASLETTKSFVARSYVGSYHTKLLGYDDADTYFFKINGERKEIRLAGADAPEIAHRTLKDQKEVFEQGDINPFAYSNKLFAQPYSRESTDYVKNLVSNKEVTLYMKGEDKFGRVLARVVTSEGKDVSKELIKQGLAHAYVPGHPYHDKDVWDEETEESYIKNVLENKGLYSNKEFITPVKYKHGAVWWLDSSYSQERKQALILQSRRDLKKDGVSNEAWYNLYNRTESNNYLLAPSQLGSSYFYGVALHNQLMGQSGYDGSVTRGNNVGIGEVLYNMGANATGKGVTPFGTIIARQYDKELYQQGIGMWLNENFFMPQGYGRAYKDEVGFIPSLLGGIGHMLDKSYLYYSIGASDLALSGQEYRDGLGYSPMQPKQGLFEATFEKGANFAISAAGALGFYLAVGEPVNLLLSEAFKAETESNLNMFFAGRDPFKEGPIGEIGKALKNNPLAVSTVFGVEFAGMTGAELKYQVALKVKLLHEENKSFYGIENFSTTPYHFNTVFFREKAASLLENTLKPFVLDYVNPFTPGSEKADKFVSRTDSFIEEIRKPPDIKFRMVANTKTINLNSKEVVDEEVVDSLGNKTTVKRFIKYKSQRVYNAETLVGNIQSMEERIKYFREELNNNPAHPNARMMQDELSYLENIIDSEKAKLNLSVQITNVGVGRQKSVAKSLQGLLDVVPLNPLHWRMFGGINNTDNYMKVGSIFSFEDASTYMRKILFSRGGFGEMIERATVIKELPDGRMVKDLFKTWDNAVKTGFGSLATNISENINKSNDLARMTAKFRAAEEALGDDIHWDALTGRTAHIRAGDAEGLLEAVAEYDKYLQSQKSAKNPAGLTMEQMVSAASHSKDAKIDKLVGKLEEGLGIDVTMERHRSKWALLAAGTMFTVMLTNDLFQSTSGVSLTTQLAYALNNANEDTKVSTQFSGNRFIDLGGPVQNILGSSILNVGIVAGARHIALAMRKEGFKTYSLSQETVDRLATPNTKGRYWSMERVESIKIDPATGHPITASIKDEDLNQWKFVRREVADLSTGVKSSTDTVLTSLSARRKATGEAFEKVGYQLTAVMHLIDEGRVHVNTAILSTVGLLGIGGIKAGVAAILNASRDTAGSLDPLIAGIAGGSLIGLKYKSPIGGVLGALGSAAITTMINATGLKIFKIGGMGKEVGLQAQTAGQLEMFSRMVRNNPNASAIELQAAFYSSEMSKLLSIYDTDKQTGRQVQVVARQIPLPFIQFFLAKQIRGEKWVGNQLSFENASSYYSIGIQASPLTGMSLSVQLPFKIGPGGVMGVSYNENTNLFDIYQGATELAAASSMAIGGSYWTSKGLSLASNKLGFSNSAKYFEEMAESVGLIRKISRRSTGALADAFLTTNTRTLSILANDYYLGKTIMEHDSTLTTEAKEILKKNPHLGFTRNAGLYLNAYWRKGLVGLILGGTAASIGYQVWSDQVGTDINQSTHGLLTAGGGIVGGMGYAAFSLLGDRLRNIGGGKVGSKITGAGSYVAQKLFGSTDQAISDALKGYTRASRIYRGIKGLTGRYAAISAIIAGATWIATDSRFGLALGMDRKIHYKEGDQLTPLIGEDGNYKTESDYGNKLAIVGGMVAVGTPLLAHIGRFGLSPSETVRRYGEILRARSLGQSRSVWQRITDRFVENDAQYLIEKAGQSFRHLGGKALPPQLEALSEVAIRAKNLITMVHSEAAYIKASDKIQGKVIAETYANEILEDVVDSKGKITRALYKVIADAPALGRSVAPRMFWRKLFRVGVPAAVVSSLIFGQVTAGNSSNADLNNFFKDADRSEFKVGGIRPMKVLADMVRLVTGRDYIDMRLISGDEFGRPGALKVSGSEMIMAKTSQYNGFVKALNDIKSMFVFDEPNAFFTIANLGGVTFRPGEKGTRVSYYAQMQSAGQDVSTAVYSMSSAFAFKEMLAGALQQNLLTDIAVRGITNKNISPAEMKIAAVKLLNVTSQLQPLKKRRRSSRLNDSVIDLAGKDSLLASVLTYREQIDAQKSYQPGVSLFSQMLREATDINKKGTLEILKGLSNSDPVSRKKLIHELFGDKFGNEQRTSRVKNINIFGYDFKTKKNTASAGMFEDESQWATAQTLSGATERQERGLLDNLQYLWEPVGGNIPAVFSGALVGGMGLMGISGLALAGARFAQYEETSVLVRGVEQAYTPRTWYAGAGAGGKKIDFVIKEWELPGGTSIAGATDTGGNLTTSTTRKVTISSNNRYYSVNSMIENLEQVHRGPALNEIQKQLKLVKKEMGGLFEVGWGEFGNKAMYPHMLGDFNEELVQIVKDNRNAGELVSTFRSQLIEAYKKQFQTIADNVYGAIDPLSGLPSSNSILGEPSITIKGEEYKLTELLQETPLENRGAASKRLAELHNQFMKDTEEQITKTVDFYLENNTDVAFVGNRVVNNVIGAGDDVQMQRLTSHVMSDFSKSDPMKFLRNQLGILQGEDTRQISLVRRMLEEVASGFSGIRSGITSNIFVGNAINTPSSTTTLPSVVGGINNTVTVSPPAPTQDLVSNPTNSQSSRSPIIKNGGRTGLVKGLWKGIQGLMVIQDMFTAFDIVSGGSRLAGAYNNPYARTEDIKQAKREFGMIATNSLGLGLAFGAASTYAVSAIGSAAMSAIGVGTAGGIAIAPIALTALAVIGTGILAMATWKNTIKPAFSAIGESKIFKQSVNGLKSLYYGVSDSVGEFLGGTLPDAVGSVAGNRGRSATVMLTAGAMAAGTVALSLASIGFIGAGAASMVGASASAAALATLGVGLLSGGTLLTALTAGAAIGALVGAVAPRTASKFLTNISRSLYNVPFLGQILVTNPNEQLLAQDRFRKGWRGAPISFGVARDVIKQEFAAALNSSEDFTGKSTVGGMVDSTLYGYGGTEGSYAAMSNYQIVTASWAIHQPRSMISSDLQRELEIRAQNYNQAITGNYNWRVRLREADNYRAILNQEKQYKEYKRRLMIKEAEKQVKLVQKITPVTTAKGKLGQDLELAKCAYVVALCEQTVSENNERMKKVAVTGISIMANKVRNKAKENIQNNNAISMKKSLPTNEEVKVSVNRDEKGVVIALRKEETPDAISYEVSTKKLANTLNNPALNVQLQALNPAMLVNTLS